MDARRSNEIAIRLELDPLQFKVSQQTQTTQMKQTSKIPKSTPKKKSESFFDETYPQISAQDAMKRARETENYKREFKHHTNQIFGRIYLATMSGEVFVRYKFEPNAMPIVVFDCVQRFSDLGYQVEFVKDGKLTVIISLPLETSA